MWASWGSSNRPNTNCAGCRPRCLPTFGFGTSERIRTCGVRSDPAATTTTSAATRVRLARCVDVLHAGRLGSVAAILDQHPPDERVRPDRERARQPVALDVGVHRRLAGVRGAALQARAALLAVLVDVGADRLERRADGLEPALGGLHAPLEVPIGRAVAHAEVSLDAVVVGVEIGARDRLAAVVAKAGRGVPLVELPLRRAQRHLRVDRRAAPDAPPADHHDRAEAGVAGREREAQRPPVVVRRPALPAREVGRHVVTAGLEQQHRAAALGELAGDDAAAGARADDDNFEAIAHDPTKPR